MFIIIIAGLLNIVAAIAFLAWSETRSEGRKAIQQVSTVEGLSCGQLRLLRGIAKSSEVSTFERAEVSNA